MITAFIALVAFGGTISAMYFLRPLCLKIGMVDHPDSGRKQHGSSIPLAGGLGILAGVLLSAIYFPGLHYRGLAQFLIALTPLLVVGVWDDLFEARVLVRFAAQIGAALIAIYRGGAVITNLGGLFEPSSPLTMHASAVPFTVFCIVGVVNAVNMIDGADGLAGGLALITLAWFATAALVRGAVADFAFALAFFGAVAGFLVFNHNFRARQRASVFLGDAGSMMLGLALAWLSVCLSQADDRGLPAMAAVWVVGVPVIDALAVIAGRVWLGRSPFKSDQLHIHFVLMRLGFSGPQTVAILLFAQAALGSVGIGAWKLGMPVSTLFYGALAVFAVYLAAMLKLWRILKIPRGAIAEDG